MRASTGLLALSITACGGSEPSDKKSTRGDTTSVAGDTAMGDTATGDTAMGDTTMGDTAMGDITMGDTAMGDTTMGDTTMGDTAMGDTAMGDTAMGDVALGDPVPPADNFDPPTVTPQRITINATGCTGTASICVAGDTIEFSWDSSPTGDDNPDVTLASQVDFDLSAFGLGSVAPFAGPPGVFSYTFVVLTGALDAAGLSFAVTATNTGGFTTGPVTSGDTVSVDNQPPAISGAQISVTGGTGTATSCPTPTFIIGDTLLVSWDASVAGANADIFVTSADLSDWGGPTNAVLTDDTACGGTAGDRVWLACWLVGAGFSEVTSVLASLTAIDDAGNATQEWDDATQCVDNLRPEVMVAVGSIGSTSLSATLSEPVYGAADCSTGIGSVSAFTYNDSNSLGATGLLSLIDGDGSDGLIGLETDANFDAADDGIDTLGATGGSVFDCAGNDAATTAALISLN